MTLLHLAARHGRWVLVAGLMAGFALPGPALILQGWIPQMVILLLFVSVLRMDPADLLIGWRGLRRVFGTVLTYQMALPLGVIGIALLLGQGASPVTLALILTLAAPSIVSSPNLTILMGHPPGGAMRLLIAGTMVLPLTVIPIFLAMPQLGGPSAVIEAALRLTVTILSVTVLGLLVRRMVLPIPSAMQQTALEGLGTIVLAVFVVGLMAAVAEAVRTDPLAVLFWLIIAFALNIGLQVGAYHLYGGAAGPQDTVPRALIAGNRNLALFLVALPLDVVAPALIYVGCYQLPMYLTPILLGPMYGQRKSDNPMK